MRGQLREVVLDGRRRRGVAFRLIVTVRANEVIFTLLVLHIHLLSAAKIIGIDRASEINSYLMRLGLTLGITNSLD